jgi:uncharacterized protein DUF6468
MMLSFWTDAIVAILLIATIGYSVVLNRRLTAVRSDREKFEDVIRTLSAATLRAEAAVANLRAAADDSGRRLDKKIEEARGLSDDLAYMIERGAGIADKMAGLIRNGRDGARAEPRPESRTDLKVEHKVEAFVQRPQRAEAARSPAIRNETYHVEPRSIPSMPERHAATQQPAQTSATSRAERELLRALSRRR